MRQPDPSPSCYERDKLMGHVLKATWPLVATLVERSGRASALVTLTERVAHEVGMFYVVNVLFRRLFRNASLVGYPRFFISQARVLVVLGVGPGTVCTIEVYVVFLDTLTPVFELYVRLRERRQQGSGLSVGPFVRDCETERLFLCCLVQVFTHVVRLGGPPYWAQRAHKFSACERDRGMHRVLSATALGVTFLLPLLSSRRLHARHASRVGRPTDVGLEKATTAYVAFRLCSTRGSCYGVSLGDSRSSRCVGHVLAARSLRRASALVTLTERVAHEMGMLYVVNVLFGPFVRDCETERLFLCCVVRVGYWPDQPVVRSRVVASFFPTRAMSALVMACVTCRLRYLYPSWVTGRCGTLCASF
ncbi:hypothetical protein Taro_021334, partial [Colocasia esculenta]|nr:hypothetical protein [Colocasia esculenta]